MLSTKQIQHKKKNWRKKKINVKKQAIANAAPRQEANYKLNEIEVEILKFESSLKAANEIFEDGNNKLQEELSAKNKHLGCNKIQCVQSKIQIGIQRKNTRVTLKILSLNKNT